MNRERLLNVARALRESPKPEKFDMEREVHGKCGTPACAWGHYAARTDLQDVWKVELRGSTHQYFAVVYARDTDCGDDGLAELAGYIAGYDEEPVLKHFEINDEQHSELFEPDGCGGATTPIAAAEYIEDFVRRHEQEAP